MTGWMPHSSNSVFPFLPRRAEAPKVENCKDGSTQVISAVLTVFVNKQDEIATFAGHAALPQKPCGVSCRTLRAESLRAESD